MIKPDGSTKSAGDHGLQGKFTAKLLLLTTGFLIVNLVEFIAQSRLYFLGNDGLLGEHWVAHYLGVLTIYFFSSLRSCISLRMEFRVNVS